MSSKLLVIFLIGLGGYMLLRNTRSNNNSIHDLLRASPIKLEEDFQAITSLVGSEEFYVEIRNSNPLSNHLVKEKSNIRDNICASISNSTLFSDVYGLKPVDLSETEILDYFKFNSLNIQSKNTRSIIGHYTTKHVSVHQKIVLESVFVCFSGIFSSENVGKPSQIVHYYVSREYEFANWGAEDTYPRKCRFVFMPGESGSTDEIVPIAITDKPAHLKAFVENQDHYEKLRVIFHKRESWNRNDSMLCDLTALTKIRLCTILSNAKIYRDKYKFSPHKNAKISCQKHSFTVHLKGREDLFITGNMLGFNVESIGKVEPVQFLVTYGRTIHELFVGRGTNKSTRGCVNRLSL